MRGEVIRTSPVNGYENHDAALVPKKVTNRVRVNNRNANNGEESADTEVLDAKHLKKKKRFSHLNWDGQRFVPRLTQGRRRLAAHAISIQILKTTSKTTAGCHSIVVDDGTQEILRLPV